MVARLRYLSILIISLGFSLAEANGDLLRLYPAHGSTRAVALVAHGLNNHPERMSEIIRELNVMGISCVNVALSGHRFATDPRSVTSSLWLKEMKLGFTEVKRLAGNVQVPTYFVGFSLGGLVGVRALQYLPAGTVNKMLLLAPALALNKKSYALRVFSYFPSLMIPSLAPKEYRYRDGTAMAQYNALFEMVEQIQAGRQALPNVPSVIIVDPEDELVSAQGLKALVVSRHLKHWQVFEVESAQRPKGVYKHLILDELSMGSKLWNQLTGTLRQLFQN